MLEHGGFTDVKIVGGTGDQGADVVAMQGSIDGFSSQA